jgi:hypothetical protein
MTEQDPLGDVLREWKSVEPTPQFDQRVLRAYRQSYYQAPVTETAWQRFWKTRISIPLPVLLASSMLVFALVLWLRPAAPKSPPAGPGGFVTQLDAEGFQPLPHGEARVVSVKELRK